LKDAVDIDIHKEGKNKITTKFKEKGMLSTVPFCFVKNLYKFYNFRNAILILNDEYEFIESYLFET
jgi:hypothetical protein